jgi:hypothetical protein
MTCIKAVLSVFKGVIDVFLVRFWAPRWLFGVGKCMHCMQCWQLAGSFRLSAISGEAGLDPDGGRLGSPVPGCEGPGAPSTWSGKCAGTRGTRRLARNPGAPSFGGRVTSRLSPGFVPGLLSLLEPIRLRSCSMRVFPGRRRLFCCRCFCCRSTCSAGG